jgi:hypothetical protein
MSLLFIEGFDFYQNLSTTTGVAARWTINSTSGASLVSGRFGGQAFRHSGSTQRFIQRSIPATNTLAIGLAIKIEDASAVDANRPLITFLNASGTQCGVGINSSGQLIAFNGGIGTVLGTGAEVAFQDNVWYYLEVEVFVHDSTGSIVAYTDGDAALSVTGADTRQQTGDDITLVRLFGAAATSANPPHGLERHLRQRRHAPWSVPCRYAAPDRRHRRGRPDRQRRRRSLRRGG